MKTTKKQVKAQLINEVQKTFANKLKAKEESYNNLRGMYEMLSKDYERINHWYHKLEEENQKLKGELAEYKDWIERMQDFCNLPEEERVPAIKQYLADKALESKMEWFGSLWRTITETYKL